MHQAGLRRRAAKILRSLVILGVMTALQYPE